MTDTQTPNLDEIKETIKLFGNKEPEEILKSLLEGKKLSNEELHDLFYEIMPWMSLSLLNKRYVRNKKQTQKDWDELVDTKFDLDSWGTVENLEILPLIDASTDNNELKTENGVSYLIKADDTTILFDLGLNKKNEHPSPLLHNMKLSNVNISDINHIFISHPHGDHCGGGKWVRNNTFGLSAEQQDLSHITAYTPTKMNHPTATVKHITKPEILGKGIASIGPITQPMYFGEITIEQSLVINLKGKGLVIIVGCGHQSVRSIVERTENLVDKKIPIYAFIGGVHLPFLGEPIRQNWMGLPYYKFSGTRRPIWEPWTIEDVYDAVNSLKERKVKIVSISTHDSTEQSIGNFRDKFLYFEDLKVGKTIPF